MTDPRENILDTLARYTVRLRRRGVSRTAIIADLLYAAAGIALVDGANTEAFIAAAAMAWSRFVSSLVDNDNKKRERS